MRSECTQTEVACANGDIALKTRAWRTEPDGPNDRQVDIWYNGKWIPAFFSDIKAGDFFLLLDVKLDPTQCFYAASDCQRHVLRGRWGAADGHPTHVIRNGSEIVQAPALKDINSEGELTCSKSKLIK